MAPSLLTAIIADDESLARDLIAHYLKDHSSIRIVAECKNGVETVNAISELRPDLLFLDIQMPDFDGFGVIHMLDPKELPLIIFVTAHEKFALKAFEVSAVDYLLKPFGKERFDQALEKALRFSGLRNDLEERISRLITAYEEGAISMKKKETFLQKILVKESKRIFFIETNDIYFFEAAGDYLIIHTADKKFMIHENMNVMEQKLDPAQFARIHRSTIISIQYIKELQPYFNGEFYVTMKNGALLKLSRSYREQAKKIFGET